MRLLEELFNYIDTSLIESRYARQFNLIEKKLDLISYKRVSVTIPVNRDNYFIIIKNSDVATIVRMNSPTENSLFVEIVMGKTGPWNSRTEYERRFPFKQLNSEELLYFAIDHELNDLDKFEELLS